MWGHNCILAKDAWFVLVIETVVDLLEQADSMGSDFNLVDCALFIAPFVPVCNKRNVVVGGCSVWSVLVRYLCKLMPVGRLETAACVLVGDDAQVDVFNGVFEAIHQQVKILLINSLFLESMHADEVETNSLDIKIVDSGMSEYIVDIERHIFNSGVFNGAAGLNWQE